MRKYWYFTANVNVHSGDLSYKNQRKVFGKVVGDNKLFPFMKVRKFLSNGNFFTSEAQRKKSQYRFFAHPDILFWSEISKNDYSGYLQCIKID